MVTENLDTKSYRAEKYELPIVDSLNEGKYLEKEANSLENIVKDPLKGLIHILDSAIKSHIIPQLVYSEEDSNYDYVKGKKINKLSPFDIPRRLTKMSHNADSIGVENGFLELTYIHNLKAIAGLSLAGCTYYFGSELFDSNLVYTIPVMTNFFSGLNVYKKVKLNENENETYDGSITYPKEIKL